MFVLERIKLGGDEFERDWAKESENDQIYCMKFQKIKIIFKKQSMLVIKIAHLCFMKKTKSLLRLPFYIMVKLLQLTHGSIP